MRLKTLMMTSLIALNVCCIPMARSQQASSTDTQRDGTQPAGGNWPTPEEAVARMSAKLNLTDDQKAAITPVIADRQTRMRALMADNSGRPLQKVRKEKSIMSDSDKKIEAVLTKDQKKTYAEM